MRELPADLSTTAGIDDSPPAPWRSWLGRLCVAVLTVVVLLGGTTLLGVRTATAQASSSDTTLVFEYPAVARAGMDVTWRVRVTRPGGFGKLLTLAVNADAFSIYEHQAFYPEPDSMRSNGDTLELTFIAPPSDEFVLDFDAYVQPSSQEGIDQTVSLIEDGQPEVTVQTTTWLVP